MTRAAGRGRLAYAGWNLLLGLPFVLVSAFPPALQLVLLVVLSALLLPFVFRNIRSRLQNIGWDASGGKVLLWMLGGFVPILNLVLGLTLLFTPGRQSQAAAGGVGTSLFFSPVRREIVAPAPAVPAAPTVPASSVESALRQLQGFHAAGLITTAEYEAKKTDVLGRI